MYKKIEKKIYKRFSNIFYFGYVDVVYFSCSMNNTGKKKNYFHKISNHENRQKKQRNWNEDGLRVVRATKPLLNIKR